MPASLILEGLAQTGGILVGEARGFAEKVVLAKMPKAEFFGVAFAGDQLVYEATLTDLRTRARWSSARCSLDGEPLAYAEIVFAHLDNSRANQIFGAKNFVFTQTVARRPRPGEGPGRGRPPPGPRRTGRPGRGRRGPESDRVGAASRAGPLGGVRRPPMPRPERRVLITGLGIVCPIGDRPRDRPGRPWPRAAPGVDPIRSFAVDGLPTDAGGEVRGFELKTYAIPSLAKPLQKSLKYMARDIQLAVAAAAARRGRRRARSTAGVDPTRFGVDLGAGPDLARSWTSWPRPIDRASGPTATFDYRTWGREAIAMIPPIWLLKYLPNMLACHISILIDCQGPSNTITEAEAASNLAIGEACRIIAAGPGRRDDHAAGPTPRSTP